MSRYEKSLAIRLIQFFICEIKAAQWCLESADPVITSFRRMARASLKMYFVWFFEAIQQLRRTQPLPRDFDYMAMKALRNGLVHKPKKWADESVIWEISSYVDQIDIFVTNLSR